MSSSIKKALLWAMALLTALSFAGGCAPSPEGGGAIGTPAPSVPGEKLCFAFMKENMVNAQGGLRTNYLDGGPGGELAKGEEVLSESMGLWMLYLVEMGDEPMLRRALGFVEDCLDTGNMLSYRYSPDTGAYPVNAFLDDMRIIRALLLAGDAFGGDYRDKALAYADRLYATNVRDGCVYDMYDETLKITNDFITLCYLDIDTMGRLGRYDARWEEAARAMERIAAGGYLGDDFPLYAKAYRYDEAVYDNGDIDTVQALITALSLAQVGRCPEKTLDYLAEKVKAGTLYGAYRKDGTPVNEVESTAIYALCAMIFSQVGDGEHYDACISRMEDLQVNDPNSELNGAFADPKTKQLYAFDNLTALLAFRQE